MIKFILALFFILNLYEATIDIKQGRQYSLMPILYFLLLEDMAWIFWVLRLSTHTFNEKWPKHPRQKI
jgi:hypothetical protein